MNFWRPLAFGVCLAAALGAAVESAQADSVTIDGIEIVYPTGAEGTIPSGSATNDIFGSASGYYGATLKNASGGRDIRYTYIGAEAGYKNQFFVDGSVRFTHAGSGGGPSTAFGTTYTDTGSSTGDTLDFKFKYDLLGTPGDVLNGSNVNDEGGAAGPNFFIVDWAGGYSSYLGKYLDAGLYIVLDDGGAGDDDNHDDMVIRIEAVPEPGSIVLLGMGVAGLAVAARKRRSA